MQSRYQIYIYFDGSKYVATVPELDGCAGTGHSYAKALSGAEKAIATWVFDAINAGKRPPEPASDFVLRPLGKPAGTGTGAPIMRRLRQKFGNLGSRQLMEKLDIQGVSPTAFAGSAAGLGVRAVRIGIALALNERPSSLWPHVSPITQVRDDAIYMASASINE